MSTSAAPFFFKPKDVNNLDTFQDGGLRHNNPAFLASWEAAVLWPDRWSERNAIDYMVSLGTGTGPNVKQKMGPHSPVKDRSLKRLFGTLMGHIDSEEQWKMFFHCLPLRVRHRYHRLNIYFPGPEPGLDEVRAIESLKQQASQSIASNYQADLIISSIVSSIFYFELESWFAYDQGYMCSGVICCRLPLEYTMRERLYHTLVEKKAFFLVMGRPVPCVENIPKGIPAFRRSIKFGTASREKSISISLAGLPSRTTAISGMPTSLERMIEAQCLEAPFGRVDYSMVEKALPKPGKRKFNEI